MNGSMATTLVPLTGRMYEYPLTLPVFDDEEKLLAAARVAAMWTVLGLIVFVVVVGRDVPTLATLIGGLTVWFGIRVRGRMNGHGK